MNLLPDEFSTLQDCLVDTCESQTKGSAGLRRSIEEGRGDGVDGGQSLHRLAETARTNTMPHRLELKTQDGLPSDLKLKPFMVPTQKKVMKLFSLLGKGIWDFWRQ